MDSVPLVCITGQVPTHLIGTDAFQECDTTGITRPCTKHNWLVKDVNKLSSILHKAFEVATTGRPGPVLIDIPKDIGYNFDNAITEEIKQLKTELFNSTTTMLNFLTKNTDFRAVHPFFGELTAEQWLLIQKKHFTHHLSQFGLL